MERGFWALSCEDWDNGLRKRAWAFLRDFIGKGGAGWGVWCAWGIENRDEQQNNDGNDNKYDNENESDDGGEAGEGRTGKGRNRRNEKDERGKELRVYCWGTIVCHTYLLLHMASESKVRTSGARWVAGDGEVVVLMPT